MVPQLVAKLVTDSACAPEWEQGHLGRLEESLFPFTVTSLTFKSPAAPMALGLTNSYRAINVMYIFTCNTGDKWQKEHTTCFHQRNKKAENLSFPVKADVGP